MLGHCSQYHRTLAGLCNCKDGGSFLQPQRSIYPKIRNINSKGSSIVHERWRAPFILVNCWRLLATLMPPGVVPKVLSMTSSPVILVYI